jgi:NTP pyrophosphatase (non-canonical NTP hydrolase)
MALLKEKPTLADLQKYIKETGIERGWDKNNHLEIFLLFSEEIGELAKEIRNYTGLYAEEAKKLEPNKMEGEFADVLNYLLDLANCFNIDLEKAFRDKDKENANRTWIQNKQSN